MDATVHVYTFKEGLLSKLAHDLRLTVTRFEISARGTEIDARFDATSLRVDGAIRDGKLDRNLLSASDKQKIQENIQRDVLHTAEHPEIRFSGRAGSRLPPFQIEGELMLGGASHAIELLLSVRGERLAGELELSPSRWGVKPFRALGGTLKVQDRVRIAIQASAEWLADGAELNPAVQLVWQASERPSLGRSWPP